MYQAEHARKKEKRLLSGVLSWIKTLVFSVLLALFLSYFVIANASIASGSMENTIMTDDRVMCNRLAYLFSEPKRFDIILFEFPYGDEPINYVKRIIGLPGEKVEIIDGRVYINDSDKPLEDSFTLETPHGNYGPFHVPKDHYFVLGDNRNHSFDSKSWDIPYLSKETFLGKAVFSYYPRFRFYHDIEA